VKGLAGPVGVAVLADARKGGARRDAAGFGVHGADAVPEAVGDVQRLAGRVGCQAEVLFVRVGDALGLQGVRVDLVDHAAADAGDGLGRCDVEGVGGGA